MSENENKPSMHTLHIRLSANHFIFALYEPAMKEGLVVKTYEVSPAASFTVNLKRALTEVSMAKMTYRRVKVLVNGPSTFIPLEEFQEEEIEDIFHYNYPDVKSQRILYTNIPQANIMQLFTLQESVYELLEKTFTNVHYQAISTPVFSHFTEKSSTGDRGKLYAYFHENEMDVAIFKGGKTSLLNTFHLQEEKDSIYYLLYLVKQTELNQHTDSIYLTGKTINKETLVSSLSKYMSNVSFINPGAEFNRHPVARHPDMYYDLITLLLQSQKR